MQFSPLFAISGLLLLAACASQPKPAAVSRAPQAGVKIGNPYQVFGKTYVPRDDRSYDARGIASWYGPNFHAKPTANGEIYNQDDLTAAHKTLPMPSWVEVTNLDNGRQLTVRINDRGPFVDGRIIDLSRRSAQLLGVERTGLANVRVRRVYPPHDWARSTAPASRHIGASPTATAQAAPPPAPPPPAPRPAAQPATIPPAITPPPASPLPVDGRSFVQVAALADRGRAEYLAQDLRWAGAVYLQSAPNGLWRVRVGPFAGADAQTALEDLRMAGHRDAHLVRE